MKNVFLDANILLEILFKRSKYDKVVDSLNSMQDANFYISALSVDIVMYFVEQQKQSKDVAWQFLDCYNVLDLKFQDLSWAKDNDMGDFEDALQVGCAIRGKCDLFITLDKNIEPKLGKYISVKTVL